MGSVRPMLIVPVVAFAGMAGLLGLGPSEQASPAAAGYLDRPLPDFQAPPMAGTDAGFTSADLSGRVALLNVFAAWCPSCREEHPFLMALAEKGDVPIYGLNWKDAPGAGKIFLADFGNPYVATAGDGGGSVGNLLQVTGVPETYIIDPAGRIRYRHLGPITDDLWSGTLKPLIADLEGER